MSTRRELKRRVWKALSLSADGGLIEADLSERLVEHWGATEEQRDRILAEVQRHFARLAGELTEAERVAMLRQEIESERQGDPGG